MIRTAYRETIMDHRRTWILLVTLLLLGGALAALAVGCTGAPGQLADCGFPIVGRRDHFGRLDQCCQTDPCPCACINSDQYPCDDSTGHVPSNIMDCVVGDAGTDASACLDCVPGDAGTDVSASCGGTCAPIQPFDGWEGPGLFWSGPSGTAPKCPDHAPVLAYQGHGDDLVWSPLCDACTCAPSTGDCAPPASIAASSAKCDQLGTTSPFDGPAAWDGSCTANDCICPAPQCTHALSVLSLAVGPLVLTDEVCAASPTTNTPNTPTWMTDVLACRGMVTSGLDCTDASTTCVPSAAPPDFQICIFHHGETTCPDSYPYKHVAYTSFDDTRGCTLCTCGTPAGGSCTGNLTIFTDTGCTMPPPPQAPTWSLTSTTPACVGAGAPLGSKTVTDLAYQPGTCAPSGGPSGSAQAAGRSTFCCLMS
jgi:hypothetical protein